MRNRLNTGSPGSIRKWLDGERKTMKRELDDIITDEDEAHKALKDIRVHIPASCNPTPAQVAALAGYAIDGVPLKESAMVANVDPRCVTRKELGRAMDLALERAGITAEYIASEMVELMAVPDALKDDIMDVNTMPALRARLIDSHVQNKCAVLDRITRLSSSFEAPKQHKHQVDATYKEDRNIRITQLVANLKQKISKPETKWVKINGDDKG